MNFSVGALLSICSLLRVDKEANALSSIVILLCFKLTSVYALWLSVVHTVTFLCRSGLVVPHCPELAITTFHT